MSENKSKIEKQEEEPQVFAVSKDTNGLQFTRRDFLEVAAVTATVATLTSCGGDDAAGESETPLPDTPFESAEAVVALAKVNTYAGPGIEYDIVGSLDNRTTVEIVGRYAEWFQIRLGERLLWIPNAAVDFDFKLNDIPIVTDIPTPVPTPSNTPTPEPFAEIVVNRPTLYVRAGPGPKEEVIGTLKKGDVVRVEARDEDGLWLQIFGSQGWIAASVVDFDFDIEELPVAGSLQPTRTPQPSSTPTPTTVPATPGKVEEGDEGIEFEVEGKTYSLPCGAPIPAGSVCTCNCVSVPAGCGCVGQCSCVGRTTGGSYWYPN